MTTRKIRTEEGLKKEKQVRAVPRTYEEIIRSVKGEKVEEVAITLSDREVLVLIDAGLVEDVQQKILKKRVDVVKAILKEDAKMAGWHERAGELGTCVISPSTTTTMKASDLRVLLDELKKPHLFEDLVSVKIGEVKKYLGEEVIKPYVVETPEEFASVSLKVLKKVD